MFNSLNFSVNVFFLQPDAIATAVTEKINSLLESFLGINDIDLANSIWEHGQNKTNTHDFALALSTDKLKMIIKSVIYNYCTMIKGALPWRAVFVTKHWLARNFWMAPNVTFFSRRIRTFRLRLHGWLCLRSLGRHQRRQVRPDHQQRQAHLWDAILETSLRFVSFSNTERATPYFGIS